MEAFVALFFGLLIGSFLNVCIHRWPRNRSVVRPRSHCVRCRKTIAWYDNIPIASWLILGGRCRHCKARISWRYPLVEAMTGAAFGWIVWARGVTPAAGKLCVFSAMTIALIFCDLEKRILPDEFTLGGTLVGLGFAPFVMMTDVMAHTLLWLAGVEWSPRWASLAESVLGAAAPAAVLWGGGWLYLKIRHKEGLGLGDVKLIAMVGSFLGVTGALTTLAGGSLAGSVIGLAYIKLTGKDAGSYELPFGTFLGAAALAAALIEGTRAGW
ncbi:MAG: prepilin peptidase [Acidobacteriota bacterium]|nr:prepilin peptidase [Acidobacteriota bacterium]